jgi:catalase
MTTPTPTDLTPDSPLIKSLLEALDQLFGLHAGHRPVHAKGAMCSGTFTPSPAAAALTCAPHIVRPSTPILVRFSDFAGVPMIPDNDPNAASPRGIGIRFQLGEHVHTDIVGHSADGFPTRTGEEFLEFARAIAASNPSGPHPTPIEAFVASHPGALRFVQIPKPIPTSFARESFFGVTALKFTNAAGLTRFGRFRILPVAGNEYLDADSAAKKSPNFLFDELNARLAREPVKFRIVVQLAEPGDDPNDATTTWPSSRKEHDFGTLTVTARADDADPEIRKIIFDPIPRVEGLGPSDDPLLAVRAAIYLLSGRRRRAAAAAAH